MIIMTIRYLRRSFHSDHRVVSTLYNGVTTVYHSQTHTDVRRRERERERHRIHRTRSTPNTFFLFLESLSHTERYTKFFNEIIKRLGIFRETIPYVRRRYKTLYTIKRNCHYANCRCVIYLNYKIFPSFILDPR